jgi:hypothetical protein
MQVVGLILTLLSITLVVAPVGAVAVIYQNNLTELVIPPEINSLITGDSNGNSFILNDSAPMDFGSLISPKFVSADIDNKANTFTIVVDVTNNVNYTFTLNSFNTDIQSAQDGYQLVSVQLSNPSVTLTPGGISRVIITGSWSDASETYFTQNYGNGATSITVQLVNTSIDVNGITITLSDPITVDVPLTQEG